MKTITELKQHCLNKMNIARELQEGAKAAGSTITEARCCGEVEAYHDIHSTLVIYFKVEPK